VSEQEQAAPGPARPALRIVKGDPTPEEIAALVAVLARMGSGAAAPAPPPRRSEWASHHRRMRPVLNPGPGAWRASALPR
jgi:hypothetical protein